jgi:hypothetical protein
LTPDFLPISPLSEKVAEKTIRADVLKQIPGKNDIKDGKPITIDIDTAQLVRAEYDRLQELLKANDIEGLIARYPVRETPALARIAEELGFQDRQQYEAAVL